MIKSGQKHSYDTQVGSILPDQYGDQPLNDLPALELVHHY